MHLFYAPNIESEFYTLSEEESQHCTRVLRLTDGEIVELTDGKGFFYKAEIVDLHHKHCGVKIIEKKAAMPNRNCKLHIAAAPVKNLNRFEIFIEKAVEIGIDEITLLKTRYSERKDVKQERIEKIILSAVKQSQKAHVPILNETISFKHFIKKEFSGQKFVAHCRAGEKLHLKEALAVGLNALILIGPEGDFSEEEVEAAKKAGFSEISLSKSRLRTETAALMAVAIFDFINI
jgi:16S rRNA (uracil1498-N3)-methyltransferase